MVINNSEEVYKDLYTYIKEVSTDNPFFDLTVKSFFGDTYTDEIKKATILERLVKLIKLILNTKFHEPLDIYYVNICFDMISSYNLSLTSDIINKLNEINGKYDTSNNY